MSELIFYRTEDGKAEIHLRAEEDTVWLTQAEIADLFATTPQNITQHIRAILDEGELQEQATCKDYLQVRLFRDGFQLPQILFIGGFRLGSTAVGVEGLVPLMGDRLHAITADTALGDKAAGRVIRST